jgi:hypothetical protein
MWCGWRGNSSLRVWQKILDLKEEFFTLPKWREGGLAKEIYPDLFF